MSRFTRFGHRLDIHKWRSVSVRLELERLEGRSLLKGMPMMSGALDLALSGQ